MSGAARSPPSCGPVVVACGDRAIAEAVERAGGRAVLTDPALPTGSDRIHAAIAALDPERAHDAVINVQGDMPMLDPGGDPRRARRRSPKPTPTSRRWRPRSPIRRRSPTPASTRSSAGFADPARPARALYFSKAAVPWGEGPHYEHIGLYAYRRAALDRFVALPRGVLEQRERLEQLRALEAGMRISVSLIDPARLGVQVDTPADLARARELMERIRSDPDERRRGGSIRTRMPETTDRHDRLPGRARAPIPTSPAGASFRR